jgi:hypothetical protein
MNNSMKNICNNGKSESQLDECIDPETIKENIKSNRYQLLRAS